MRRLPRALVDVVSVFLLFARVVVFLTAKVGVPILLHLLARIFGRHLDRVAEDVRHEGDEALARIAEVQERLHGTEPEPIRARVAREDEVIEAEIVDDESDASRKGRKR